MVLGKQNRNISKLSDAMKLLNARVNNLESNLHIEIDMERIEDRSKLSQVILGIEVADALKINSHTSGYNRARNSSRANRNVEQVEQIEEIEEQQVEKIKLLRLKKLKGRKCTKG